MIKTQEHLFKLSQMRTACELMVADLVEILEDEKLETMDKFTLISIKEYLCKANIMLTDLTTREVVVEGNGE